MLSHRVIPCLLLSPSRGGLVKTLKFASPRYVGDPINAVHIFNQKEVDELIILDIDASREGRGPKFDAIEELASECFMPLCYGGGIRTADDAFALFSLGIEKVAVQTAIASNPSIVRQIASRAGEQAVVASLDVKQGWFGDRRLHSFAGAKFPFADWKEAIRHVVELGAGEILINSVDRDGTLAGPDLELIREANAVAQVPLISVGGVSSLDDIKAATEAGASAVAAGAFFVLHGPHRAVLITYPRYDELRALWSSD
jgi:cyclase